MKVIRIEQRLFVITILAIILGYSGINAQSNKGICIDIGNQNDVGYTQGKGILPNKGVNDPHVHIFKDKAYLFASHDTIVGKKNKTYTMMDWNLYSSKDLVHWEKEFVLKPEHTFIGKSIDKCFATDGATRNGKYYYYYSNFTKSTGVAVSDQPGGPYVDTGKPVIPYKLSPKNKSYDPTIFIDDDGKHYIVWGNTGWENHSYQIAELNDDMVSLKTKPRNLIMADNSKIKHDASYLHKHNGVYYLNAHKGKYATSKNLYGPYTFRGAVEANGDHGTFFTWHNQTYYIAGGWAKPYFRYTYLTYAHYKDNGEIIAKRSLNGEQELGVGRYDASRGNIEGECFFAAPDGLKKKENKIGFEVQNITDGSYLFFPKVYNILEYAKIKFRVSSAYKKGGVIEVHQNSTEGPLLGICKIKSTKKWDKYKTYSCKLKNTTEPINLYLVFKSKKGNTEQELMRLDWFNIAAKELIKQPSLRFDDKRKYTNQTFTIEDKLEVKCEYQAGTGKTISGVTIILREMNKQWKPVKTFTLIDKTSVNTQEGSATVSFDLEKLTPTKELPKGHFYHLYTVMKTSEGKSYKDALRMKIKLIKK